MKELLNKLRYVPGISRILYPVSRALHAPAAYLHRTIPRKVRRNGGSTVYDGVPLNLPEGVGADFLSLISWHGVQGFEPNTWRELRRPITDAGTFLDVGANVGLYSVLAHRVKPGIEVISFEPVPGIHRDCVRLHQANGVDGAEVRALALSDADGEATLWGSVRPCLLQGKKTPQHAGPGTRAALRVELAACQVVPLHDGADRDSIVVDDRQRIPAPRRLRVKGVHEVDPFAWLQAFQHGPLPVPRRCQRSPSDVGNPMRLAVRTGRGYGAYAARQQAQAAVLAKFLAGVEHYLQPDTDAQKRPAGGGKSAHEIVQATGPQFRHCVAERTDAGEHQA